MKAFDIAWQEWMNTHGATGSKESIAKYFYELGISHERSECFQTCDKLAKIPTTTARICAIAIKARGEIKGT